MRDRFFLQCAVVGFASALAVPAALAQAGITGLWQTWDDDGTQPKALVQIEQAGNELTGRVVKILDPKADPHEVCTACEGARHGQPILQMQILGGLKAEPVDHRWTGGWILDPENGKEYRVSLEPVDGGSKLLVKGYWGPFWRSELWTRKTR